MDNAIYSATEDRENEGCWPSGVLPGPAEENAADPVFMEGVLPQEEFPERLRFEKRRVDHEILEKAEAAPGILPLESLETVGDARVPQVLKRWLDILGSLIGLVCFFPVVLITAIAIKLASPGPIIFRQTRLGRRGNHFDLLSLKNDSRISPVGKFIRKLGLDQLPQFFNVLKGEMSLVGPRPPILHEVEKFKSGHLRRILAVKPGITGLWQVEGRSPSSLDEMIRLDLRFILLIGLIGWAVFYPRLDSFLAWKSVENRSP